MWSSGHKFNQWRNCRNFQIYGTKYKLTILATWWKILKLARAWWLRCDYFFCKSLPCDWPDWEDSPKHHLENMNILPKGSMFKKWHWVGRLKAKLYNGYMLPKSVHAVSPGRWDRSMSESLVPGVKLYSRQSKLAWMKTITMYLYLYSRPSSQFVTIVFIYISLRFDKICMW